MKSAWKHKLSSFSSDMNSSDLQRFLKRLTRIPDVYGTATCRAHQNIHLTHYFGVPEEQVAAVLLSLS